MDGPIVALTVVIAYDISEDRRRSRASATLQQWGDRVQRSVFVCTVEPDRLTWLKKTLGEIIDADTDSVYLFRQCASCWETVGIAGQAHVQEESYYWSVL